MLTIARPGENLISVKGFTNDFSGRYLFREIVNPICRDCCLIKIEAECPASAACFIIEPTLSFASSFRTEDDGFSLTLEYEPDDSLDQFIETVIDIWELYEFPSVMFFLEPVNPLRIPMRAKWSTVTSFARSYVLFKSTEEDVIWVGKSPDLSFVDALAEAHPVR